MDVTGEAIDSKSRNRMVAASRRIKALFLYELIDGITSYCYSLVGFCTTNVPNIC